jgi:hypothetical protein
MMIAAIAPPITPHTAGFTDAGTFICETSQFL